MRLRVHVGVGRKLLVAALCSVAGCASLIGADFDRPGVPDMDASLGAACTQADACKGKCGQLLDACGSAVECGSCPGTQSCGGAGTANVCGLGTCAPSCAGKACGQSDGCSRVCTGTACGGACGALGQPCCDGGACDSALTCAVGPGGAKCECAPSCADKPCGADDGCGGKCEAGSCASGLHCVSSACVCDGSSCHGCCSGNVCQTGASDSACGHDGVACAPCKDGTACTQQGACQMPVWKGCFHPDVASNCDTYCAAQGYVRCANACVFQDPFSAKKAFAGLQWTDSLEQCGSGPAITPGGCGSYGPPNFEGVWCCCSY
jgi:hypothetical protein